MLNKNVSLLVGLSLFSAFTARAEDRCTAMQTTVSGAYTAEFKAAFARELESGKAGQQTIRIRNIAYYAGTLDALDSRPYVEGCSVDNDTYFAKDSAHYKRCNYARVSKLIEKYSTPDVGCEGGGRPCLSFVWAVHCDFSPSAQKCEILNVGNGGDQPNEQTHFPNSQTVEVSIPCDGSNGDVASSVSSLSQALSDPHPSSAAGVADFSDKKTEARAANADERTQNASGSSLN